MEYLLPVFMITGLNFSFWALIGIMRLFEEIVTKSIKRLKNMLFYPDPGSKAAQYPDFMRAYERIWSPDIAAHEVAVVIPAHNEEAVIARTIRAVSLNLPASNIYVGSDASSDRTVEIARSLGCNAEDIRPNRGKAGVISHMIRLHGLTHRYKAVMIVDADSEMEQGFLDRILKLFDDPGVAAAGAHITSWWRQHSNPLPFYYFTAYRIRLYRVLQAVFRYGQTWKWVNVSPIIPGFTNVYRSSVISRIDIDAPGLIIEDFNMTFEVHRKRLGRIAYDPQAVGVSQDPSSLKDYVRQTMRWNLGFWQTVKRHGFWASLFSVSLAAYILEMLVFSVFFSVLPLIILQFALTGAQNLQLYSWLIDGGLALSLSAFLLVFFAADYLLTLIVAVYENKPMMLFYGIGFIILRYLDSLLFLSALPVAIFKRSAGRWTSPARTGLQPVSAPVLASSVHPENIKNYY